MAIKTFNVEEETYKAFSSFCKENGYSMSKQIDFFMKSIVEENPKVREDYLKKLEKIRKGKYISYESLEDFKKTIKHEKV
ncbi:MAG: hypothetical protein PHG05_02925 [Candidatus Nanoarchaeia archaeon]|nr:hypothetical protein [Candidatus Nanoarchaeia archaeon]